MPTYAFEVMSPGQVAGFQPGDGFVLASPITSPAAVSVAFAGEDVTITYGGRSLAFGANFTSQVREIRPAGQPEIVIGSTGGDYITGLDLGSTPSDHSAGDALYGNAGDDTLDGGGGGDTLTGGAGVDLFVAAGGDVISDFQTGEHVALFQTNANYTYGLVPTAAHYQEVTFATQQQALSYAVAEIGAGRADVVVAQVGADLLIYADYGDKNLTSPGPTLQGVSLDQVGVDTFVAAPSGLRPPTPSAPDAVDAPPPLIPGPPTPPPVDPDPPPLPVNIKGVGMVSGDMDQIHFGDLFGATPSMTSDVRYDVAGGRVTATLGGSFFTYDAHGLLTSGQVGFVRLISDHDPSVSFIVNVSSGVHMTSLGYWEEHDDNQAAMTFILSKDDSLSGSEQADVIHGYGGSDFLVGGGGDDTLWGGTGNDVIYAIAPAGAPGGPVGATYLRGEEGDDWIRGSDGFDDANGNQGDDTISTGAGDDYCVGGKDNDLLYGDAGNDYVYGNLGNDTCEGGDGQDTVRGGQGDDIVRGGAGDDFVSGDKGSDTMTGGSGADIFHTFADAGLDVVTDFNFAEGDRVQLDPGSQYTAVQSGANVEITLTGGAKMVLLNVALLSLSPGWIFGA